MLLNFLSEFSILITSVGYLAAFILTAVAYYPLAKKRGLPHPWIACIPLVQVYTVGKVADDINAKYNNRSRRGMLLLLFSILSVVLMVIAGALMIPVFSDIMETVSTTDFNSISIAAELLQPHAGVLIFSAVLALLSFASSIIALVFQFLSWYTLYKEYAPKSAGIYLLIVFLCVLLLGLNFFAPIFVLIACKNTPQFEVLNSTSSYQSPNQ